MKWLTLHHCLRFAHICDRQLYLFIENARFKYSMLLFTAWRWPGEEAPHNRKHCTARGVRMRSPGDCQLPAEEDREAGSEQRWLPISQGLSQYGEQARQTSPRTGRAEWYESPVVDVIFFITIIYSTEADSTWHYWIFLSALLNN